MGGFWRSPSNPDDLAGPSAARLSDRSDDQQPAGSPVGDDVSRAPAPLSQWRRIDWRFLLPPEGIRRVGYLGRFPEEEARVLEESGVEVVRDPSNAGNLDSVVVTDDVEALAARAISAVRPGGWVLIRIRRPRMSPWSRLGTGSVRAWYRRLRTQGFTDVTAYWHAPHDRRCSYLVAVDDRVAINTMLRRHQGVRFGMLSLVARSVHRAGLLDVVVRDITLVARAGAACSAEEPSSNATVLPAAAEAALDGTTRASRLIVTPWEEASRHVVCLYLDPVTGVPLGAAKLPRRPGDDSGIRREAAVLQELARRAVDLTGQVPEVRQLSLDGRPFLLETALHGEAAGPEVVRATPDALVRAAVDFVGRLPITSTTTGDPAWFARLLEKPLSQLTELAPLVPDVTELVARTLELLEPLRSAVMPLVFEHGDLSHPNLLLTRQGRLAAIDWERSEVHGLPGHDLCFFLQYFTESRRGAFEHPAQMRAFDEAFVGPDAWTRPLLSRYAARLGVDGDLLPALILATWARSAASLLGRLRPPNPDGVAESRPPEDMDEVATTLLLDRDFVLWRHAVTRFPRL